MSNDKKNLLFKGIGNKEQVLFKSFLNLIRKELPYVIEITDDIHAADIIVKDDSYQWAEEEAELDALPKVVIADQGEDQDAFLVRPVQWSGFKSALKSIVAEKPKDASIEDQSIESLSEEVSRFDISERVDSEMLITPEEPVLSFPEDYEFSLENVNEQEPSAVDLEIKKVADDVKQFLGSSGSEDGEPILLVTDDESSFSSSVLVLETNLADSWELDDLENDIEEAYSEMHSTSEIEVTSTYREGVPIKKNEEFWREEIEVIAAGEPLLFVKPVREMVYSSEVPGVWVDLMQKKELTKLPLDRRWRPHKALRVYPITYLLWAYTMAFCGHRLFPDLDTTIKYKLETFPPFDVLDQNNDLLKFCTLLFVDGYTLNEMIEKSEADAYSITAFYNACYVLGLLKPERQVDKNSAMMSDPDASVIGRLKGVFR